jgi:hypothetical protein
VQHKRLIAYFSEYKVPRIGLVLGARKLEIILRQTCEQQPENLLTAFGELFPSTVRFYVYPALETGSSTVIRAKDVKVPEAMAGLYKYLLENNHVVDIEAYNPEVLGIYHKNVLEAIQKGDSSWEQSVSPSVADLIHRNHLFQEK